MAVTLAEPAPRGEHEPYAGLSRTLVIIPAYNEREALPGVLAELGALAESVPRLDVLVVDDGSTDGTAELARGAGAFVVRLPFNLGVGGALRAGFRFAANRGYTRAVQLDGDGQHDPAQVPRLLAALDGGADLVIGSRFSPAGADYAVGRVRSFAMRVLRVTVRVLAGHQFSDTTSGFRAFSRPVLERFADEYPVEYMSDTVEALILACNAGFRVVETPTPMRVRAGGAPSQRRFRLVYNYVRVLVALLLSASRSSRRRAR